MSRVMKQHYVKMIAEVDRMLDIVRASWLRDKAAWAERLDVLLKERFTLMKGRDA